MKDYYQQCDVCMKRTDDGNNSSADWFSLESQDHKCFAKLDICPECAAKLLPQSAWNIITEQRVSR